eukprot:5961375-Lingulodinium_polyedra.AAC.1
MWHPPPFLAVCSSARPGSTAAATMQERYAPRCLRETVGNWSGRMPAARSALTSCRRNDRWSGGSSGSHLRMVPEEEEGE